MLRVRYTGGGDAGGVAAEDVYGLGFRLANVWGRQWRLAASLSLSLSLSSRNTAAPELPSIAMLAPVHLDPKP
jgi:hypothetical protein